MSSPLVCITLFRDQYLRPYLTSLAPHATPSYADFVRAVLAGRDYAPVSADDLILLQLTYNTFATDMADVVHYHRLYSDCLAMYTKDIQLLSNSTVALETDNGRLREKIESLTEDNKRLTANAETQDLKAAEQLEKLTAATKSLDDKDKEIQNLQDQMNAKDAEIALLRKQIAERDAAVSDLHCKRSMDKRHNDSRSRHLLEAQREARVQRLAVNNLQNVISTLRHENQALQGELHVARVHAEHQKSR